MIIYKYSKWDGTQEIPQLRADDLLAELSDDLLSYGNVRHALQRFLQRGTRGQVGQRLMGIQDLLKQLRSLKQQELDKYDLSSTFDDIRQRLDQVVQTERQGINSRLDEAYQRYQEGGAEGQPQESYLSEDMQQELLKILEQQAAKKQAFLDDLPKDVGGAIKQLTNHDFMDPEAKRQFDELMETLKQRAIESYLRDLHEKLQGLTPEQINNLREMIKALNQMLQDRMEGIEPDFKKFMDQFGKYFGPQPPSNLDELIEQLQRDIAQMQSLMNSLPQAMSQSLRDLMDSLLDEDLTQQLAQLAANLEDLFPMRALQSKYPFQGDESLSFSEALQLMERLQQMDELESQLKRAQMGSSFEFIDMDELEQQLKKGKTGSNLDMVDSDNLRELLGEEAYQSWEQLRQAARLLEEAGYIKKTGGRFDLTPRAIRKIGQKALEDIFAYMKKERFGKHEMASRGTGGDRGDDSKPYEFGDRFFLHLEKTLMNSLQRESWGIPLKLRPEDFEVYRTETLTRASTVLMLDLSMSMIMRGNFFAAKKVALALDSLIRSQFPRDELYIVGFADYAVELKRNTLAQITWNESFYSTNMQHGFMLARKLLSKSRPRNKQIIIVTDGEPTTYMEDGRAYFSYPPTAKTFEKTLAEVKRCTQDGIIINTFMLDDSYYLREFVNRLTKINRGRAFFTGRHKLGQYILVDYLAGKRMSIRG